MGPSGLGRRDETYALLQALIANVSVTSREHIEPYVRVPQGDATAVRAMEAFVDVNPTQYEL